MPLRSIRSALCDESHTAVANSGSEVWHLLRFVTTPVFAEELWWL
jgi:hypothetical protein